MLEPTQYSTKERAFRGGIIINQAEFEVLPKEISDLLHESRRDKIIPEHERMRFDYPVEQALDCAVDIRMAGVEDLVSELKNHVFSPELINKVNKERKWTGGVVVKDTDFSEIEAFQSEVREMIETIAEFYEHRISKTDSGIVVSGDGIHLVFNKDGEITYCIFEGTDVNQIIDYEKWVELVRANDAGTPLANHAAVHISKR